MFGLCGSLPEATEVFSKSPKTDKSVWHAMVAAHTNLGRSMEAIVLYHQMQQENIAPDDYLFAAALKACSISGCLTLGRIIHAHTIISSSEPDLYVGSTLIDMYAKCGILHDARNLFDNQHQARRSIVMWNVMIAGYAQMGHAYDALLLFGLMQEERLKPDSITLLSSLKACSSLMSSKLGEAIHAYIVEFSSDVDISLSNSLIHIYCKCGKLQDAHNLFKKLQLRTVVSWNAILAGYVQDGLAMESIELLQEMEQEGKIPDKVTHICTLRSFASVALVDQGRLVHARIIESGLEDDAVISNSLIDMYSKCSCLVDARTLFEKVQIRDSVTWTVMTAGYAQCGCSQEALQLFYGMMQEGMEPDNVTYVSGLKACSFIANLDHGKMLHVSMSASSCKSDILVANALVDMYIKCGSLNDARKAFDQLSTRDVVTWNTMISGYVQHGLGQMALTLLDKMQHESVVPNVITCIGSLKACSLTTALHQGKLIHASIIESGLLCDELIGSSLITLYGECGNLEDAYGVFTRVPKQDVVTWSAMIAAYSLHKNYTLAFLSYLEMRQKRLKPDGVIIVCLLSACSHLGLIKEAYHHFGLMEDEFGIKPNVEHYNCMIDLLGRAGHLHRAEKLLQSMPFQDNIVGWRSLLGSCRTYGDVNLAERCFDVVRFLTVENASAYVLMSNIYTDAHLWDNADKLRSSMKQVKAWKKPGHAFIEIDGELQQFVVGDEGHLQCDEICLKLDRLGMQCSREGYMPQCDVDRYICLQADIS